MRLSLMNIKEYEKLNRPLCSHPILLVNRSAVNLLMSDEAYIDARFTYLHGCFEFRTSPDKFNWAKWLSIGYKAITPKSWTRPKKTIDKLSHFDLDGLTDYLEEKKNNFPDGDPRDFFGNATYKLDDVSLYVLGRFLVRHPHHNEPLFQLVPCGHCECCTNRKIIDFQNRVMYESQTSYNRPLFVTLTYTNEFIPSAVDEFGVVTKRGLTTPNRKFSVLSKDDVQKFLKRLRIHWKRNPNPLSIQDGQLVPSDGSAFRYVAVGEYGTKSQHAHYHFIFWNYPYAIKDFTDFLRLDCVRNDILRAWGMQDLPRKEELKSVQIALDCASYVAEYVFQTDKNNRKGFMTASNRGGGIGSRYLDKIAPDFHLNPRKQIIQDQQKWTGKEFVETFGQYATNRIFPSTSRLLDKRHYKALFNSLLNRAKVELSHYRTGNKKEHYTLYWQDLLAKYLVPGFIPNFNPDLDLNVPCRHLHKDDFIYVRNYHQLSKSQKKAGKSIDPFLYVSLDGLLKLLDHAFEAVKDIDFQKMYELRFEHLSATDQQKYSLEYIDLKVSEIKKKRALKMAYRIL